MENEYVLRKEIYDALLNELCGTGYQTNALYALRSCGNQEVTELKYSYPIIELHHYFEDEEFGDLNFYANIYCSECRKKITSLNGDTFHNPCESYDEDWNINPLNLYDEQYNKIKNKLSSMSLDNYCSNCGCKIRKDKNVD